MRFLILGSWKTIHGLNGVDLPRLLKITVASNLPAGKRGHLWVPQPECSLTQESLIDIEGDLKAFELEAVKTAIARFAVHVRQQCRLLRLPSLDTIRFRDTKSGYVFMG